MLVGVGDAAVMLFLEIVFREVGVTAAPEPELLDKLLALFVGIQLKESVALVRRDDVRDVFGEPLPVRAVQLLQGPPHLLFRNLTQLLWCGSGGWILSLLGEDHGNGNGKRKNGCK